MRRCVYCGFRYLKGCKVSFHKFPTDPTVRRIWLRNMKVGTWTPKESDVLCSKHFDYNCIITPYYLKNGLDTGSVPTIFDGNFKVKESSKEETAGNKMNLEEQESDKVEIDENEFKNTGNKMVLEELQTENVEIDDNDVVIRVNEMDTEEILQIISTYKNDSKTTTVSKNYRTTPQTSKKIIRYGVAHDHQYGNTHRNCGKTIQRLKKSLHESSTQKKILVQCVKRLKSKVERLKTIIRDCNKLNKIYESCMQHENQDKEIKPDIAFLESPLAPRKKIQKPPVYFMLSSDSKN